MGDLNGDGKPDLAAANVGSSDPSILLNIGPGPATPAAAVDLDLNVVNLKSHAPWVTATIEPSGFDVSDIDVGSLRLAGTVPAELTPVHLGDHDSDGTPDLKVKFRRDALDPLLAPGMNELVLTGTLVTGESFEGRAEVRVVQPGE